MRIDSLTNNNWKLLLEFSHWTPLLGILSNVLFDLYEWKLNKSLHTQTVWCFWDIPVPITSLTYLFSVMSEECVHSLRICKGMDLGWVKAPFVHSEQHRTTLLRGVVVRTCVTGKVHQSTAFAGRPSKGLSSSLCSLTSAPFPLLWETNSLTWQKV